MIGDNNGTDVGSRRMGCAGKSLSSCLGFGAEGMGCVGWIP